MLPSEQSQCRESGCPFKSLGPGKYCLSHDRIFNPPSFLVREEAYIAELEEKSRKQINKELSMSGQEVPPEPKKPKYTRPPRQPNLDWSFFKRDLIDIPAGGTVEFDGPFGPGNRKTRFLNGLRQAVSVDKRFAGKKFTYKSLQGVGFAVTVASDASMRSHLAEVKHDKQTSAPVLDPAPQTFRDTAPTPVPVVDPFIGPATLKATYVGAPAIFSLTMACQQLVQAFGGFGCYLVGSSTQRPDWRDVDVVLIMSDSDFEKLFPSALHDWELDSRWVLMVVAISGWLKTVTGLPVDFKFQPQTAANARFKGPRHSLGLLR